MCAPCFYTPNPCFLPLSSLLPFDIRAFAAHITSQCTEVGKQETPKCTEFCTTGNNAGKFKAAGFDKIACLAVNDAHVMRAWGLDNDAEGIIDMIADPFAEFSDALGLTRFMGPILGRRSTRCAMIIENGILKKMFMEEPAAFEVSSAEYVLANI